jgi:tRNA-2-methylthio-N6-dimethylallyladenosine synthase
MGEEGVAEAHLQSTYPYISLIIGTHDVANILTLLDEVVRRRKAIVDVRSVSRAKWWRIAPFGPAFAFEAYVNISYGCDKFCTYCIVPYTRGRERSRYEKDILKECRGFGESWLQEITLLGQNVNSYGLDLKDGTTFADLLEESGKTRGSPLRFLTSYPSQFTDEMIAVMAQYPTSSLASFPRSVRFDQLPQADGAPLHARRVSWPW